MALIKLAVLFIALLPLSIARSTHSSGEGCARVTHSPLCQAYWLKSKYLPDDIQDISMSECDQDDANSDNVTCNHQGRLTKTAWCSCFKKGRLNKHQYKVSFGHENNATPYWLQSLTHKEKRNQKVYTGKVREGPGKGLAFTFQIKGGKFDSCIKGTTLLQCMKICLSHNQWAKARGEPGCTEVIAKRSIKEKAPCWLRSSKGVIGANVKKSDNYSYDLKCLTDKLKDLNEDDLTEVAQMVKGESTWYRSDSKEPA